MKEKEKKYQKGITLIALVITIVVLLILAGVTLSIIFNGGIIDKSQNAVDKYSQAQQNETEILDYLNKQFSLHITVLDNINGNENKKVIESTTTGQYYNPVVPVGFKTVNTETASWEVVEDKALGTIVKGWNEGLVIEDSQGNQFVWVPVDNSTVTYGYHYNKFSTGSRELEQSLPIGITDKNNDGDNENDQITEYGGFYIARYEAGIPETLSEAILTASHLKRNVTGIPVSKKNQVPWNYISWSQAKDNAESMYEIKNSKNEIIVQSVLITDRMWETTMKWLEKANIDVTKNSKSWGNLMDSEITGITEYSENEGTSWIPNKDNNPKEINTQWLLKTGNTEYTKRKNIYDLAGNLYEWTNARFDDDDSKIIYVGRGGNYCNSNVAAAFRGNCQMQSYYRLGFRVALFVQ